MTPVVVIGAGLAGLSAACYLTGRGYDVTVIEREEHPGRPGRRACTATGSRFDTGPTVLTMPDLIADALRAVDAAIHASRCIPMRRLDPAYRACFADGSTIHVRYGREAMREEIAQTCGSVDAAAFEAFVDWLRRLYVVEMPNFIDRNFDSPLDLLSSPRALAQLLRLGAFGRLGAAVRRRFARPAAAPAVQLPGHVRRARAGRGARALRRDHLHGQHRGRLVPRGRDARRTDGHGAGRGEGRRRRFRYGDAVEEVLRSPSGRVAGVRTASGERISRRRRGLHARPARRVRAAAAATCARRGRLPARPLLALGGGLARRRTRACRDAARSPTTTSTSATSGARAFDALLKRGELMPDPSRLVTIPSLDDPAWRPPAAPRSTCWSRCPTCTARSTGERGRADAGPAARLPGRSRAIPTDVVTEDLVTPLDWQAQGMAAGTPFALAHTFAQTGPFRPANVERRLPGTVLRRLGNRARASAYRWC